MDIINMFILVTLPACHAEALYVPGSETPNVGTVLFTSDDLNNDNWNVSDLSLLRARMHLQDILPSVHLIDSINEEYLNYFIKYLEDSYAAIKREVSDPFLRDILKMAVSDTIGGYLKIWVLPITKYSYYGGTISLDNAITIFKAYDDIKKSLNTDGEQWRKANDNLLNYVSINVASLEDNPINLNENCDDLTYYEKSNAGLTFPLPFIDWSIRPTTMFVPLKNVSLIPLNSVNSSKYLLKYYDLTKHCFRSENLEKWQEFDKRFQTWLNSDIVPHLDDENLYVAFGGVLSLLNKTRIKQASIKFINSCDSAYNILKLPSLRGMYSYCSSKKLIIVGIILLVEIVWCVPALIYIVCSRKRKNKKCFKTNSTETHNDDTKRDRGKSRKFWDSVKSSFNKKTYYQIHSNDTYEDKNLCSDDENYYTRELIEPLLPIDGIKLSSYKLKHSSSEKNTNNNSHAINEFIDIPLEGKFSKYDITLKSNTSKIESSKHSRFKLEHDSKCKEDVNENPERNVKRLESKKCLTHPKNSENLIQHTENLTQNTDSFQKEAVKPELVTFIDMSTEEENDTLVAVSRSVHSVYDKKSSTEDYTKTEETNESDVKPKLNNKRPRTVSKNYPDIKSTNNRIKPGNIAVNKKSETNNRLPHVVQKPTLIIYNERLKSSNKPSRIPRKITELKKLSCIEKKNTLTNRTESLNDSTEKLSDKDEEKSTEKLNITF